MAIPTGMVGERIGLAYKKGGYFPAKKEVKSLISLTIIRYEGGESRGP